MAEAELENYSVHSFRIFVACALLAAGALRWLIPALRSSVAEAAALISRRSCLRLFVDRRRGGDLHGKECRQASKRPIFAVSQGVRKLCEPLATPKLTALKLK